MKENVRLAVALSAGLVGGAILGSVLTCRLGTASPELPQVSTVLVPVRPPEWAKAVIQKDEEWYSLRSHANEVGLVTVHSNKLSSLILLDRRNGRSLQIEFGEDASLKSLTTEVYRDRDSRDAVLTILDTDLDGIPNRRMDWEAEILYEMENIHWKPVRREPESRPEDVND